MVKMQVYERKTRPQRERKWYRQRMLAQPEHMTADYSDGEDVAPRPVMTEKDVRALEAIRLEKRAKRQDRDAESDSWNWSKSDVERELPNDGIPLDHPIKIAGVLQGDKPKLLYDVRMGIPRTIVC